MTRLVRIDRAKLPFQEASVDRSRQSPVAPSAALRIPPLDPGREQRITASDSRESPNRICKETSRHTPQTGKFDYFVTSNQSVRSMASEFFTADYSAERPKMK